MLISDDGNWRVIYIFIFVLSLINAFLVFRCFQSGCQRCRGAVLTRKNQRRVPFAFFSSPPSRPRCPDDASQKRFSWFSDRIIQKVQKCVNLVDLVKSFQTSIYYLLAKFGIDTPRFSFFSKTKRLLILILIQPRTSPVKFARSPCTDYYYRFPRLE